MAKSQAKIGVDFFKDDFVAAIIFVEIAANLVNAAPAFGPRFPQIFFAGTLDDQDRLRAGDVRRVMDFIVGILRKQREVGIAAAGSERAVAGNKHPVIRAADDA